MQEIMCSLDVIASIHQLTIQEILDCHVIVYDQNYYFSDNF